jgi:DNA-binding CsgD family transcriptional regulator
MLVPTKQFYPWRTQKALEQPMKQKNLHDTDLSKKVEAQKNSVPVKIDLFVLPGGLGFALVGCWLYLILTSPFDSTPQFFGALTEQLFRAVFFFAQFLFFLVAIIFAKGFLSAATQRFTVILSFLGALPLGALLLFPDMGSKAPLAIWLFAWLLAGWVFSVSVYRGGLFFSSVGSSVRATFVMATCMIALALIFLAVTYAPTLVLAYLIAFIPVLSSVLYSVGKRFISKAIGFDDIISIRSFKSLSIHSIPKQFFVGASFGLAAGIALNLDVKAAVKWPVILALLIAAIIFVGISYCHARRQIQLATIQYFYVPLMVIALLPIALFSNFLSLIGIALVFLCFHNFQSLHVLILADFMRETKESAVSLFSFSGLFISLGTLSGWLISYAAFLGQSSTSDLFNGTVIAIIAVAVFALAVEVLPDRPEPETLLVDRNLASEGHWRQRCSQISREAKLSPRQHEVFMLLAKGRNTSFVSNELFIAPHTTKAHIYRIYQKLNVHTQQELIDLIEHKNSFQKNT